MSYLDDLVMQQAEIIDAQRALIEEHRSRDRIRAQIRANDERAIALLNQTIEAHRKKAVALVQIVRVLAGAIERLVPRADLEPEERAAIENHMLGLAFADLDGPS